MIIATLNWEECRATARYLGDITAVDEVFIAFDPIDQSFKFKVNNGVWSPPIGTFQQPDYAAIRSWVNGLRTMIETVTGQSYLDLIERMKEE